MDWIDLALDRDRRLFLANATMNVLVSKKCGQFVD